MLKQPFELARLGDGWCDAGAPYNTAGACEAGGGGLPAPATRLHVMAAASSSKPHRRSQSIYGPLPALWHPLHARLRVGRRRLLQHAAAHL